MGPWLSLALLAVPPVASASDPAPSPTQIRLFLDPQRTWVDQEFLQKQIDWVDWVRDRQAASVHLIVLRQGTGGGGQRTVLRFLGLGPFAGLEDELTVDVPPDETEDGLRQALAARITLGLARYASRLPHLRHLRVQAPPRPQDAPAPASTPTRDPWNAWVFRLNASSYVSGESLTSSSNTWASVSARRITEDDLFRLSASGSWSDSRYNLTDEVVRSHRESYNASLALARALSDRWTWGL